jgi:capsular polysaccharide biosynthesis protein
MQPHTVQLPAIPIGQSFLERWPVRELPQDISWKAPQFECMAPATFVLRDALVYSSAGMIVLGDAVIEETLCHTIADVQGYSFQAGRISLRARKITPLNGTSITILAGAQTNYYHSVMEGLMRLSIIPDRFFHAAGAILCSKGAVGQRALLGLCAIPGRAHIVELEDNEALRVERLIFPLSAHGQSSYHPCVGALYDRICGNVAEGHAPMPRRIYLDRRGGTQRRLLSEDEIVHRLAGFGFVPVRAETLSIEDQIRLFRGAEMIVAPHGAGLTNIGFCRPGCRILELHMDAYVNWCFRHLAALRELRYDCVVGRSVDPWADLASGVHTLRWRISAQHVVAAVGHMLAG